PRRAAPAAPRGAAAEGAPSGGGETAESRGIGQLVREQQVGAEAGGDETLDFTNGRAGEAAGSQSGLPARQCGAFVRLHMRAETRPGQGRGQGAGGRGREGGGGR